MALEVGEWKCFLVFLDQSEIFFSQTQDSVKDQCLSCLKQKRVDITIMQTALCATVILPVQVLTISHQWSYADNAF